MEGDIIITNGDDERQQRELITICDEFKKTPGAKYLPYAFTEHGVTMAASVLKSPKAREMNIAIVRAFVALRELAIKSNEVLSLLMELRSRIDEHDIQLGSIYDTLENLLDKKAVEETWKDRQRIGFKK